MFYGDLDWVDLIVPLRIRLDERYPGMYTELGLYGKPGVYHYLDSAENVIYVGHSTDLGIRLSRHKSVSEKYMPDADSLWIEFLPLPFAQKVELERIISLCPGYNKQHNPHPDVSVGCITSRTS